MNDEITQFLVKSYSVRYLRVPLFSQVKVDVNGETIGSYVANHNTAPPQPTSSPSEAEHPIGPLTGSASYRLGLLYFCQST